jgi:nitrite reductase/ring-hydroxylating ferredoxin subunit
VEGLISGGLGALCRLADLQDGTSKGFPPPSGGFAGRFPVRQGNTVHVYVNACPHPGVPLEWTPDRFLSHDGNRIICATHGAEFASSAPLMAQNSVLPTAHVCKAPGAAPRTKRF